MNQQLTVAGLGAHAPRARSAAAHLGAALLTTALLTTGLALGLACNGGHASPSARALGGDDAGTPSPMQPQRFVNGSPAAPPASGMADPLPGCDPFARPGLRVSVEGAPARCDELQVVAVDGAFVAELMCLDAGGECECRGAQERAGSYRISVWLGLQVLARSDAVRVREDGCHVVTEFVTLTLAPTPALSDAGGEGTLDAGQAEAGP